MSTQIIHAISGPRNISTALMYSFAQRPNCAVIDEPFYGVYLQEHGHDHPGRDATLASWPTSSEEAIQSIQHAALGYRELYLKNMAHHMEGESWEWAAGACHVFWIRHPRKVIQSFTKVMKNITMNDIGLNQEWDQWQTIQTLPGPKIIVDSDEMLEDPAHTMPQVCEALGITWEPAMLSWSQGPKAYDGPWWPHWYDAVHRSTGFGPGKILPPPMRPEYETVAEAALPAYEHLFQQRLKFI